MNSAKQLNQRKLQYLHEASQTLFSSSPAVSAHLATKLNAIADASSIQLADSTWRKTCACCGYAFVPGWTATVRIRGLGDDCLSSTRETDDVSSSDKAVVANDFAVSSSIRKDVQASTLRNRKRGKRTRGKKQNREKTEQPTSLRQSQDGVRSGIIPSTEDTSKLETLNKISKRSKPSPKEPRMVYTCKICNRKTVHSLPIRPIASDFAVDKASPTAMHVPNNAPSGAPALVPQATPTTNATAKKRAKSRKNTLSEMLAKEQSNRAVAGSNSSNFGLDLMDFMKTS